uniref:Uncharacterized protein n=1 Tax=Anguilla anguilla TaxID=7936 RepID=A0A0E9Q8Y8_ANGAN
MYSLQTESLSDLKEKLQVGQGELFNECALQKRNLLAFLSLSFPFKMI